MNISYPELPLSSLKQAFCRALSEGSLLLEAEPGAGKSTLAPLWALESVPGTVWLVQPRVLAALSLATRLAQLLGEPVGQTVGYQVPFERCVSKHTRLVLMSPGVLLQRLLVDPELNGVDCVLLDEIHERHVDQDTAWAWLQESAMLREDLALVLMSATPDAVLRRQVAQVLYSPGRCFPVSVSYQPPLSRGGRAEALSAQLLRVLQAVPDWRVQTLLVFLPGWRDINACRQALAQAYADINIYCLHSRVARDEQTAALDSRRGPRVILATNIAETSLTIADVTLVIDTGLAKEADFEQGSGVTHLQIRRIAAANAEQRAGRAGRVQAGSCIRLWSQAEVLAPRVLPEIRRCDYLPLALRLAHWGTPVTELSWIEAPNMLALRQAQARLQRWQLLTPEGRITDLGRKVARLGTHPRIAAMLLHGGDRLLLLALALHFGLLASGGVDDWLTQAEEEYRHNLHWQRLAARWQKVLGVAPEKHLVSAWRPLFAEQVDRFAALFVERLGRRTAQGRYRLNCGISVSLEQHSDWALVLQISRRGQQHMGVGFALSPSRRRMRELAQPVTRMRAVGQGDRRRWVAHTDFYLAGEPVDSCQRELSAAEVPAAIGAHIDAQGLAGIHWSPAALSLYVRARWAAKQHLLALPPLAIDQLQMSLKRWLLPFIDVHSDMTCLPLAEGLAYYLGFEAVRQLDALVPAALELPSGRSVLIDYVGKQEAAALLIADELPIPTVAGKLQEFFGATSLGQQEGIPLRIELLSPAGRPLAVTADLAFFWRQVYPQVRREMRGRYAKHPWPEDPFSHAATAKTKRGLVSLQQRQKN